MKKLIVTIMGVMVLLLSFSMVSNALATDDGFYYKVTDNLITITGHKSITGDLIVPDEIDGISVTPNAAAHFCTAAHFSYSRRGVIYINAIVRPHPPRPCHPRAHISVSLHYG